MDLPKWVKRNPEKYKKRLAYEIEKVTENAPLFRVIQEGDGEIYFDGYIITRSNNAYNVRIHFPDNYPFEPAVAIVMDQDVVSFCLQKGMHDFHNYGEFKGGIKICVIKPDDTQGIGWDPTLSSLSLILWSSEWLHAFEVKWKKGGKWLLPE